MKLARLKTIFRNNKFIDVISDKLDDNSVDTINIKNDAVTEGKIANGAITNPKIDDSAITASKIGKEEIHTTHIFPKAITADKIETQTITSDQIALNTILGANIREGDITNDRLMDNTIESTKIADSAITEGKIAANAVTNTKIANGSVITTKIADSAVTEGKIATNAVTNTKIANGSVITEKIADKAVIEDKIAANAVTNTKIANGAISKDKLDNILSNFIDNNVHKFIGTEKPDNTTYIDTSSDEYYPKIGDIYIQEEYTNTANTVIAIYIRIYIDNGITQWKCIWSRYDSYSQVFIGTVEPTINTYCLDNDNPSIGDIYIHYEDYSGELPGKNEWYGKNILNIYIRINIQDNYDNITQNSDRICAWKCIWSHDSYIDENNIKNGAVTTNKIKDYNVTEGKIAIRAVTNSKIADGAITKDKLNSDFSSSIIYGTYGTNPMYEGDELQAGHLYIQYDENVTEEE